MTSYGPRFRVLLNAIELSSASLQKSSGITSDNGSTSSSFFTSSRDMFSSTCKSLPEPASLLNAGREARHFIWGPSHDFP